MQHEHSNTGSGNGFAGSGVPAGPSATLEPSLRELAAQFAGQNEQFAVVVDNMADMPTQLSLKA